MTLKPKLRKKIYLLGDIDEHIIGNKLPSKEQVLKVLFYNMREKRLSARESARMVVREVKSFWEKARLPTNHEARCADKVLALYRQWRQLQKNSSRAPNGDKEKIFCYEMKNLFDVAHGNILQKIDAKRKQFLKDQRRDDRVGYIDDIQHYSDKIEEQGKQTDEIMSQEPEKSQMDKNLLEDCAELASSSNQVPPQNLSQTDIDADSNIPLELGNENEDGTSAAKKSRGNVNLFNDKVIAVLDRYHVSDKDAVHLVSAIAEALDADLES